MTDTLFVTTNRLGENRDVVNFLQVFEEVYNHLYTFYFIVDKIKHNEIRKISPIKNPEDIVSPEDRLCLISIKIGSAGFWEILGSLNPLEVIRKYLNDRHERKKDVRYRNDIERQKGELEIRKLKNEIVRDQIDILKANGVPTEKIRRLLSHHIEKQLKKLDIEQDKGFAENANFYPPSDYDTTWITTKPKAPNGDPPEPELGAEY